MPRRKAVEPLPLQLIECDEFLIEVRDRATALIGRGLHGKEDFNETLNETLDFITPKAFTKKDDANCSHKEPTCLKSSAAFARYCELRGVDRETGALRKRHFTAVKA